MATYSELLKDPQWQKKRLEIMQRADFTCEYCGDKTTTLHVHHLRYTKGAKPWEYDNRDLKCACETCHTKWHMIEDFFENAMAVFSIDELEALMGFGLGIVARHSSDRALSVATAHVGFGMLAAFSLTWGQCRDLVGPDKRRVSGRELHSRMIEIHGSLEEG